MLTARNRPDGKIEIKMIGEISPFSDVNVGDVTTLLDANDKPVVLRINSPGGEVFESVAIYNAFRRHEPGVSVEIMGIAASGASVVAMAGSEITMLQGSQLMIHEAHGAVVGRAKEIRQYADMVERANAVIVGIYAKRTGRDEAELAEMLADGDTFMNEKEAVENGFATAIESDKKADPADGKLVLAKDTKIRDLDDCRKILESVADIVKPPKAKPHLTVAASSDVSANTGKLYRDMLLRKLQLMELDESA